MGEGRKMTVVKIGGCNGSGKTSLVKAIIKHCALRRGDEGLSKRDAHYLGAYSNADIVVLGSYVNVCGGMDTISDKDDRLALIQRFSRGRGYKDRIVIFEGLITGKTFGAIGDLSNADRQARRQPWLYAFMDTPFEVCVERVLQRRAARGNTGEFDPERTMRPTFKSCLSVADRAQAEGHMVRYINHKWKPETAAKNLITMALELHRACR